MYVPQIHGWIKSSTSSNNIANVTGMSSLCVTGDITLVMLHITQKWHLWSIHVKWYNTCRIYCWLVYYMHSHSHTAVPNMVYTNALSLQASILWRTTLMPLRVVGGWSTAQLTSKLFQIPIRYVNSIVCVFVCKGGRTATWFDYCIWEVKNTFV